MLIKYVILLTHFIPVLGVLLIEVSIGQRNSFSSKKNITGPYVVADLSLSQDLIETN